MLKKNKIIGFAQLRNELSKGNLTNWFKQMEVCDYIYIYDQNSDDGSIEYYNNFENTYVIKSPINNFKNEIICKSDLLNKILLDHPDTDWILWLDGDSLLDGRLLKNHGEELQDLCSFGSKNNLDAFSFDHYNLWRSDIFYRVDNSYHYLNGKVQALWRNNGSLQFNKNSGLHNSQYPNGLINRYRVKYSIIHRGFATDYQITTKYNVYKEHGQSGWALDRLLCENGLTVEKIDLSILPEWFTITDDINPINKKPIREIYNEK